MSNLLGKLPEYVKKAEKQAENIEKILEIVNNNNILLRKMFTQIDFIHTEFYKEKAKKVK